jgi:Fe-S cluster assembly protein SufD
MDAMTLTPPDRSSEAWRYVAPSLLKELAQYHISNESSDSQTPPSTLHVSGNNIEFSSESPWANHLKIIPFKDLNEQQKKQLPQAEMEEQDCFSTSVYQSNQGTWIEFPKKAPQDAELDIVIYSEGQDLIQNTRLHFEFPSLSEHRINLHFKGPDAQKYANLSELTFHHSAGSSLKLSVLCDDGDASMSLTGFQHLLKRDSRLSLTLLNTENRLTRHRLRVDLSEENAEVELQGLGCLSHEGHLHHYLDIRHLVPHCRSKQLFKTALSGKARSSFDGTIHVSKHAIATVADQLSRYLLLSPECRASAKPQLKIYADDVVCTHGSTIGQLEEEELFYLQTRGLSKDQSQHLLARGFLEEILSDTPSQTFAAYWRKNLLDQQFPVQNT